MPLDTVHFKDLQCEILECLGDLDSALDGEMIKSDNWQALNTLRNKYRQKIKCIYIDPPFNLDSSDQFAYRTNYKDANWATMLENRLTLARDFLADDGGILVRCDYNGNWIVRCLLDSIFGHDNFKNEVIVNRTQEFFKSPTPKQKKLMHDVDSILISGKSDETRISRIRVERTDNVWHQPFLPKRGDKDITRIIDGKKYTAPNGRQWGLSQDDIDMYYKKGRINIEKNPIQYSPIWRNIKNNWTDIPGYSRGWGFDTENSEELLSRSIQAMSETKEYCLDFFSGSGTTQAVAQKLGRKWLGVEMGEHFDTVILPRLKKVLSGHKSGISKNVEYKGGGGFVYYSLEQYEETLKNMRYKDGDLIDNVASRTPFEQYVFLTDDKFAKALSIKGKGEKGKIQINLSSLYKDIDLPQTLSVAIGSPLRRLTETTATFANGNIIKLNPAEMSEKEKEYLIKILRPFLWWGREGE